MRRFDPFETTTAPTPRTEVTQPAPPMAPTPAPSGRAGFTPERRREIEDAMKRMREEMERLRTEMNRLRSELGQNGLRGLGYTGR